MPRAASEPSTPPLIRCVSPPSPHGGTHKKQQHREEVRSPITIDRQPPHHKHHPQVEVDIHLPSQHEHHGHSTVPSSQQHMPGYLSHGNLDPEELEEVMLSPRGHHDHAAKETVQPQDSPAKLGSVVFDRKVQRGVRNLLRDVQGDLGDFLNETFSPEIARWIAPAFVTAMPEGRGRERECMQGGGGWFGCSTRMPFLNLRSFLLV